MRSTSASFEQVFLCCFLSLLPLKENTTSHICGDAVLTGALGVLRVFLPSPSTGNPTETLLHMLKTHWDIKRFDE